MQGSVIAIAIACVLAGLLLAIFVVYCYFLLKTMVEMNKGIAKANEVLIPLLSDKGLQGALKSIEVLGVMSPQLLDRMTKFNVAMTAFCNAVLSKDAIPAAVGAAPAGESGLYAYDEATAAKTEEAAALRREGIETDPTRVEQREPTSWVGAS